MTTWAATRDRNGTDVIAGGITANADPVTVAQGERPRPRTRWRPRRTTRSATRSASRPPGLAGFSCHRIPALTTATNGWIIAAWDGRPDTCHGRSPGQLHRLPPLPRTAASPGPRL